MSIGELTYNAQYMKISILVGFLINIKIDKTTIEVNSFRLYEHIRYFYLQLLLSISPYREHIHKQVHF